MSFLTPVQEKRYSSTSTDATTNKPEIANIAPKPSFVIKTKIFSPFKDSPTGTKLFINVCTNEQVPVMESTPESFQPEIIFGLIMENKWEIPILTSPNLRNDKDKKGQHSLIIDCIINDKLMRWCLLNKDLKLILIEWCFDAVEFKIGDELLIDREVMIIPKRTYMGKGDIPNIEVDLHVLKNESKELRELNEKLQNNETLGILEAKRFEEDETESNVVDIFGINRPVKRGDKPLIQEISEMSLEKKTSIGSTVNNTGTPGTAVKNVIIEKKPTNKLSDLVMEIKPLKEDDTLDNYKFVIQMESKTIKTGESFKLRVNRGDMTLQVTYEDDSINIPLPLNKATTLESVRSFFVNSDSKLYVFVK